MNMQNETNGMATAAMVIGIIGLVVSIIPVLGMIAWLLCPLAIILGFIARGKPVGKGAAMTGIITGGIGLLISIAWVTLFATAFSDPEFQEKFQEEMERVEAEQNAG